MSCPNLEEKEISVSLAPFRERGALCFDHFFPASFSFFLATMCSGDQKKDEEKGQAGSQFFFLSLKYFFDYRISFL